MYTHNTCVRLHGTRRLFHQQIEQYEVHEETARRRDYDVGHEEAFGDHFGWVECNLRGAGNGRKLNLKMLSCLSSIGRLQKMQALHGVELLEWNFPCLAIKSPEIKG